MNTCEVQSYADGAASREELAQFLAAHVPPRQSAAAWRTRFEHWWDANPFRALTEERGWVLRTRTEGELVGFLGLIPSCYAVEGEAMTAVAPTTWVVDSRHRASAILLGRQLLRLQDRVFIISTTGRKEFQTRMARRGWVLNAAARRQFVPCGAAARLWLGSPPELPAGSRIVTSLAEVNAIARPYQNGRGIEKWITLEALRWYLDSPARPHRFAGVVDASGCLTAYLLLTPAPVLRLLNVWSVVDWFQAQPDQDDELRALLAAVAASPGRAGLTRHCGLPPLLLRLTAMQDDPTWASVRGLMRAPVRLNHLHLAPATWPPYAKRCVLAEGDLGL